MASPATIEGPSIGELLGSLARDTGLLVRQEVHLASTEMTLKAKAALRNMAFIAAGGALALAGFLALMLAAIFALQAVMPLWLASLATGGVVILAGYVLAQVGLSALRRIEPLPEQTMKTLKDDVVWAKETAR